MRIKSLKVQNFTSLADIDLPDLPNLVVFIGKNSSGKSNLIDALALLFSEFGTHLQRDLGAVDAFQHLFYQHNVHVSPSPEITATITLSTAEWAEVFATDLETASVWAEDEVVLQKRLVVTGGDVNWVTSALRIEKSEVIIDGEFRLGGLSLDSGTDDEPPENFDFSELVPRLAMTLKSAFNVIYTTEAPRHWDKRFSERPTIVDAQHVREMWDLSQSSGSQRQPWMRTKQRYEEIAPNQQTLAGVTSSIQLEESYLTIPIGMTGEGSQAMLRLIDRIERGSQVMAIEEPETHLHPGLVKRAGQLLVSMSSEDRQFFVCTHSPFLIEQSSLESFYVVKKEGVRTEVSPMRNIEGLRDFLFDMGMRPSDILFSDAILLVEGASDETFFNIVSNKINASLAERHVRVVRANGDSRGRRKIEFWAEVGRDAGLPLYIILDKGAANEAERAIENEHIKPEQRLILEKGDLEDYYPWEDLKVVLEAEFGKAVEEPIDVGKRVVKLRELLGREKGRNWWKPTLAEEVAGRVTPEQAEAELKEIVDFLHAIHRSLGTQ